ncbi:CHAT domain-containing protein [Prosthecobacter sp.]|uniref:CHAT domain-containing protein n=1 Tax=Prosthecobacter sp. TaxID=1965333 RepID=UPI003782DE27
MSEWLAPGSKILFITAAPTDQDAIGSLVEHGAIVEAVLDKATVVARLAAQPEELVRAIQAERPTIVHFSGHGTGKSGLVFETENGATALFTRQALDALLAAEELMAPVRLMVLNACSTVAQAEVIAKKGPDTIAMQWDVLDEVAGKFAKAFYRGLFLGNSPRGALQASIAIMTAAGVPEPDTPAFFPSEISKIKDWLGNLEKLMGQNKAVKKQIEDSRQELQMLHALLDEFKICKQLHDHLHKVQLQYPTAAKAARADLSDDDVFNLYDPAVRLMEDILLEAQAAIEALPAASTLRLRELKMLKGLGGHVAAAKAAEQDSKRARDACGEIGAQLRRHLPRINSLLTQNAEAMDLSRLGTLFQAISTIPELPQATQKGLLAGQAACESVGRALNEHTQLHGEWQAIDRSLWDAESALLVAADEGGRELFLEQWLQIKQEVQRLANLAGGIDWATRLSAQLKETADAVDGGLWSKVSSKYERLCRDIRKQFFEVDNDLLTRADQISELGRPLDPFLPSSPA